jgi:hypothetical protein
MAIPDVLSLYRFCSAIQDAGGTFYLTDAPPYGYEDRPDTIEHRVTGGDTWHSIAARYYSPPLQGWRAELLGKVIADFQPEPVDDTTIVLVPGTVIYVPGINTVVEVILSESRRSDYER